MQKDIVTQGETAAIAKKLDILANSLDEHANQSLSKAHAINALAVPYADSGGDVVGENTLRFVIGNNVLYAPARIPTVDPGPSATGSGKISAEDVDTSVGTPNNTAVVTEFSDPIIGAVDAVIQTLGYHAGLTSEVVHGDTADASTVILDSLGHRVGRRSVIIVINGVAYAIPADYALGGPTQLPQLKAGCPSFIGGFNGVRDQGGGSDCSLTDSAPDGIGGTYNFTMQCLHGTAPIVFQWQVSLNGSTWIDMNLGSQLFSVNGWFNAVTSNSTYPPNGVSNVGAFTTIAQIRFDDRVTNTSKFLSPAYLVRCKFDNSAIPGGGIVYSGIVSCNLAFVNDE